MNPKPDNELIEAVQSGDIAAFEVLVRRYQHRVYAQLLRLANDHELAQEVVQDTFFSVYRTIDRVDPARPLLPYLFTIARNGIISRLRRDKREVAIDEESAVTSDAEIYERVSQEERKATLQAALDRLEPRYRSVLQLYYYEDLSYEEISTRLRLPLNTIRTHIRRGREQLRRLIPYE